MFKDRLFNIFIVIAVVIIAALTVREASATAAIISERDEAKGAMNLQCASLPSRYSSHTGYVQEADMWIVRAENGPTGVDGGMIELLSTYRTCSR